MFAVATSAAQGGIQSGEVLLIIATVAVAFFWRVLIRIGLAAIVIGFAFLMVSGLLEFFHGLRSLIP
jgi:hypothetical protein